ncbi:MAG: DUF2298 domain-containing protein [Phototrophicaceae bacterium]
MLFDWLAREGWIIFNWWLLSTLMGLTVFPLLTRLLPALPDRGYTLMRPAGLLLVNFVFWFLAVLGFVDNAAGSILLAWLVVLVVSVSVYRFVGHDDTEAGAARAFNWRDWWQENKRVVVAVELLFVVLLVGFAIVRAYQNDLTTTEKPMDLAFMSAIQHTAEFPPNDPWLSGYSISYYYFGYVMAATMGTLAGVASTITYNIQFALLFALTGTAAFGVVYNLIRSRARPGLTRDVTATQGPAHGQAIGFGVLGMVFLLIMSNFHMVLVQMPYVTMAASEDYLRFWDAKNRAEYQDRQQPVDALAVEDYPYWWWFDASRVITERALDRTYQPGEVFEDEVLTEPLTVEGARINEVIDEFPMFSFLLGDSHPHVMALPFVLLAVGLALNVMLSSGPPTLAQTIFYGVSLGGLIFLNTWDAPIYLVVLLGAEALRRVMGWRELTARDLGYLAGFGLALVGVMLLAYLPFIIGFRSQLGGVLPNVLHPTRPQQMFVMFGPFILLLVFYLVLEIQRGRRHQRMNWLLGTATAFGVLAVLVIVAGLLVSYGMISNDYRETINTFVALNGGWGNVNEQVIDRRIAALPTLLALLLVIIIGVARLFPRHQPVQADPADREARRTYPPASGMALLLTVCAAGLILIPEFVYLRDNFTWRMNTVFKFYYQAWVMFSIASAYAVYTLTLDQRLPRPIGLLRMAYGTLVGVVLVAGLIYGVFSLYHRMFVETGRATVAGPTAEPTLDGGPGFVGSADYKAIMCLDEIVGDRQAVIAEARPQGSNVNYNPRHGRVGTLTGIPIIMGWPGHQSQWRGTGWPAAEGSRPEDLDLLYTASTLAQVLGVIERYDIDYIMYGATERQHYGPSGEQKFLDNYAVVCEEQDDFGVARVYRVDDPVDISQTSG